MKAGKWTLGFEYATFMARRRGANRLTTIGMQNESLEREDILSLETISRHLRSKDREDNGSSNDRKAHSVNVGNSRQQPTERCLWLPSLCDRGKTRLQAFAVVLLIMG